MRFWLAILLLLPAVFAEDVEIPEEYITASEAKQIRENGETLVIAFSTKHCPHCQRFGQMIPKIRETLKELQVEAKVHKMDTRDEANKEFVDEHDIRGVPTVFVYVGEDKGLLYSGERDPDAVASFVQKVQNLEVKQLGTQEEIDAFKAKTPALLAVVDENAAVEYLATAAKENLDINFAYTTKGVSDLSSGLHMFRDDGFLSLAQDEIPSESAKLYEWFKVAALRAVTPFPSGARDIFSAGVENIIFVVDVAPGILDSEWLKALAEKLRGKVVFSSIDRKDESASSALEFFGIETADDSIAVRLFNDKRRKQFKMDAVVTAESLEAWLEEYLAGNVAPHMKTEKLPEDWDQDAVKVIVGSNFKEVAFDASKDVFVFFHAPWCGHCKKMSPDFTLLAEKFADNDNIVFAKLDATANDIEDGHTDISGFPTLRFYKSGTNEIIEYDGNRDLETLTKFITETMTVATSKESEEGHSEL